MTVEIEAQCFGNIMIGGENNNNNINNNKKHIK